MKLNQSIGWDRAVRRAVCAGSVGLLVVPGASAQEKPDRVPEFQEEVLRVRPMRLTVQVVGEDGKAIEGSDVGVSFSNPAYYRDGYNRYTGKSGPNGKFSVESEGYGSVGIGVTKVGYYRSIIRDYNFVSDYSYHGTPSDVEDLRAKHGKPWQPWDPTVRIIMKRIIKPIPMYVRETTISEDTPAEALATNKDMEWDMFEGQWLPPYGKGNVGDLVVRFAKSDSGTKHSYSMTVKFPNKDDGLIAINELVGTESELQFPREAPADDYNLKSYTASIMSDEDRTNLVWKEEPRLFPKAYFIRLRTRLDEKGKVVSAHYGKITTNLGLVPPEPPIRLRWVHAEDGGRKIGMEMVYYLNPTPNDHSLEFDGKTNKAGNKTYGHVFQP